MWVGCLTIVLLTTVVVEMGSTTGIWVNERSVDSLSLVCDLLDKTERGLSLSVSVCDSATEEDEDEDEVKSVAW